MIYTKSVDFTKIAKVSATISGFGAILLLALAHQATPAVARVSTPHISSASVDSLNKGYKTPEVSPLRTSIAPQSTPSGTVSVGADGSIHSLPYHSDKFSGTQGATETPKEIHRKAQRRAQYADGGTPIMTATDKREILWLARILYSETKRPHEQRLVGWVVRNRVDTGYTGRTYERVANRSAQFSGLHPSDPQYEHNMSRWWASDGESWESALRIAKQVYFAPENERPFSVTTRHFYSPVAVYDKPHWARGRKAVRVIKSSHQNQPRFAFYARVR